MEGYPFTWERSRGEPNWVEERLDRALATREWLNNFENAVIHNLNTNAVIQNFNTNTVCLIIQRFY